MSLQIVEATINTCTAFLDSVAVHISTYLWEKSTKFNVKSLPLSGMYTTSSVLKAINAGVGLGSVVGSLLTILGEKRARDQA